MSEIRVLRKKDNTFMVAVPKLYVRALGLEQGDYLLLKLVRGAITIEKLEERPEKTVTVDQAEAAVRAERKGWERWIAPTVLESIERSLETALSSQNDQLDEETPKSNSENSSSPSDNKESLSR